MKNISYLIPVFNAADTLAESVHSIFRGNFVEGDEVIIVDDASTDNSLSVAHQLQQQYAAIKVIQHKTNKGSAAAGRNTAIDNATHDLFFCLDADNILVENSVRKLLAHLETTGSDCVSFGEIRMFQDSTENIIRTLIMKEELDFVTAINQPDQSPCSYGNYLLTRQSWKNAGRYNESVGGAYDSLAFGLAQLGSGTKMRTLKGSYYLHRAGYDSTYMREYKKRAISLLYLQIVLPYIHLIHPDDVQFMMSEGRLYWAEQLAARPLRAATNTEAPKFSFSMLPEPPFGELLRMLGRKIRRKLTGK